MGSAFATNERHTHTFTSRRVGTLKLAEKRWVDHDKVADTNTDEASHKKKKRVLKLMFAFLRLYIFEFTDVYMTCT